MDTTLYPQICDFENLQLAYQNASRGKRGHPGTAAFEYLLADNLLSLKSELLEKSYMPGSYRSFYIHEPKRRLISAAPFRDRVVHHALCNLTIPYFENLFITDSFANRIGKGTHKALNRCQQFARRYKYVLQCDVVQFFPSIDHVILLQTLRSMVPLDADLFWLIESILESGRGVLSEEYRMVYFPGDDLLAYFRPRGLPIGNLTSQWWANCYLNPFDHFVRRELGCRAYLRYVDDFALFSDSKEGLWRWRKAIIQRLARLRLTIHIEKSSPFPVQNGIPFLGFVIFPDHRRLKRRKGIAYERKLRHLIKTADYIKIKASLQGWLNHARWGDTYGLRGALLARNGILAEEV